jgi:glycogen operon protein
VTIATEHEDRQADAGAGRPVGVSPGRHDRLGATVSGDGVTFCVYARRATGLDLLLFGGVDDVVPTRVIHLDPRTDRTGDYWHVHVRGIEAGQLYGWSADGPWEPHDGLLFDSTRVLLDPYGRAVATPVFYRRMGTADRADEAPAMKSVVVDTTRYDWEGDRPLGRTWRETVIYEAHLAGFTADPSSGVEPDRRGTYAGFIEKIPYLVDLGITAVELLPVFAFDRLAAPPGLVNYWGYQPVSFFAPHQAYASRPGLASAVDEFRDLVKALHRAGIEVILDVVYNHTAEVGADGPTFCFRGLANDDYYLLDDAGGFIDDSGTGNTFNANRPIVRRLIVDSLRYWVQEMHVDGFRFDLAAVLSRDEHGLPMADPPALWDIETDPVLAGTKLIAEAWDAGGLYQVGTFVGERWVEWNGRFRDDVRSFVKGDRGMVSAITQRFLGSPDIYGHKRREPEASVNCVTCHDGFTLNDLVSYDTKHNEANGEGNRDGNDQNLSWNCGVEGSTTDAAIEALRARQIRNFLAFDLLALGAPMLLMGDEVRRTQAGNNNAYGHDDPLTWFDWTGVERHADIHRFTRSLIAIRRRLSTVLDVPADAGLLDILRDASLEWSGVRVGEPDLGPDSHSVALTLRADQGALHLIFNAYWEPLDFALPTPDVDVDAWRRIIDTSLPSPDDVIQDFVDAPELDGPSYRAEGRSVVVLAARRATGEASRRRTR